MASTAQLQISSVGAAVVSEVANGIQSNVASGIVALSAQSVLAEATGAITSNHRGGITPGVAGGIHDGGQQYGIVATTPEGISDGGVVNGIGASVAGGIGDGGVVGGLGTSVAGGFALGGGALDWPTFGVGGASYRSKPRMVSMKPNGALASGWTGAAPLPGLVGPGNTTSQFCVLEASDLHNGATLLNFTIYFIVGNSHAGGAPGTYPTAAILRYPIASPGSYVYLLSTGGGFASATNAGSGGSGWYASGATQSWTYTCNQHNVIDTTQYAYALQIIDENGSNAESGNTFLYANAGLTFIPNMAFP